MMSLIQLLFGLVFAAEQIISPLPDNPKPEISFGSLARNMVLGMTTTHDTEETVYSVPVEAKTEEKEQTVSLQKKEVTIALLGDSMTDTLGIDFPALQTLLKQKFPGIQPFIINYGVGGTNIDQGIPRITSGYSYQGRSLKAMAEEHPDIVILESFAYNPFPFDEGALEKHWLSLSYAVDSIRTNIPGAKIVIGVTIAPNTNVFGDGAGLSFQPKDKQERTNVIRNYLESTIQFAKGEHFPLADAYTPSRDSTGNGILKYINRGDDIHPSGDGATLYAQAVVTAIVSAGLLQ